MMIKWFEDAINDLRALRDYIARENPKAANKIASRILGIVELLPDQPSMGRIGRVSGTRELVVPNTPYIIPYRVRKNTIEILRVFHGAMQWQDEF